MKIDLSLTRSPFVYMILLGAFYGCFLSEVRAAQSQDPPAPISAGTRPLSSVKQNGAVVDLNYQKCGQDCLYQKANENVSIQMLYVIRKMDYLTQDPPPTSAELRGVLGAFCRKDEKAKECRDRYIHVNQFWLLKARGALSSHEMSILELNGNSGIAVGTAPLSSQFVQDESQKSAQTPFFSKSEDLGKQMERLDLVRDTFEDQQWLDTTYASLKPSEGDFILFKEVIGPDGMPMEVPDFDQNHKPKIDQVAYKAAVAEWETGDLKKKLAGSLGGSQDRLTQRVKINTLKSIQDMKEKGVSPEERSNSRILYEDSRAEYYEVVNDLVSQTRAARAKSVNYPQPSASGAPPLAGGKPNPSSAPPVIVSKPQEYHSHGFSTGKEQIVLPPNGKGSNSYNSSYSATFKANQISTDISRHPSQAVQGSLQTVTPQSNSAPQDQTSPNQAIDAVSDPSGGGSMQQIPFN